MKDLTDLRKIAEAATQGNWIPFEPGEEPGYWWVWLEEKLPWYGGIAQVSESDPGSVCQAMITDSRDPAQDKADAVHIATFQPSTILALITRLEQAELHRDEALEANKRWAHRSSRECSELFKAEAAVARVREQRNKWEREGSAYWISAEAAVIALDYALRALDGEQA